MQAHLLFVLQAGTIILTHELNNYTMQEAINFYPKLKAAFKALVPVGVAYNWTSPYVETNYSLPSFSQCELLFCLHSWLIPVLMALSRRRCRPGHCHWQPEQRFPHRLFVISRRVQLRPRRTGWQQRHLRRSRVQCSREHAGGARARGRGCDACMMMFSATFHRTHYAAYPPIHGHWLKSYISNILVLSPHLFRACSTLLYYIYIGFLFVCAPCL